jgi:threonine synthase
MSTAHPAKFGDVVEDATGVAPAQPEEIKDLYGRTESCTDLPNELNAIMEFVSSATNA